MRSLEQLKVDARREGWVKWIRSTADEAAVLDGCWFDVAAGEHWCEFFNRYLMQTMGKWAGQPFKLLDWQRDDLIMPLFGWKRDRSRPTVRRYSKGDIFVAKKQGKSTIAAGLACAFLLNGGPRVEAYGVAHTREQASIIYREAAAMARNSPKLKERLRPIDSQKRIVYGKTSSFYAAMAGENNVRGIEGVNPLLILFDEIHVQRSRQFYDALAYASAARENSLMLSVSTVGVADTDTIWWEQYEYAKAVISGSKQDNARFAYIAQADEECKSSPEMRMDPKQWLKAMPSLGHTVTEEKIREAVIEAENSPAKLNNLLRYVFNIPTAQIDRVIPMESWKACEYQGDWPDLSGRECILALDVASSEDLTALAGFFPPIEGEDRGWFKPWFWCPEAKLRDRELRGQADYGNWQRHGYLQQTNGEKIAHDEILAFIRDCYSQYRVKLFLFDKWNADAIVNPLIAEYGDEVQKVEQSFAGMAGMCSMFLSAIVEGKFWHDGNKVMSWCCENAGADNLEPDVWKFSKKKSADKIDGVIVGAMCIGSGLAMVADDSGPSIYESEGNLSL